MLRSKIKVKTGATSFYVVAISTLILVILATSFATAIMAEIIRSSNDEIAQSATDSAMAGVEEAKLAYENYRNCVNLGYASEEPNGDGEVSCPEIIYWVEHPDEDGCDMVAHVLGRIRDNEEGREVKLEQTATSATSNLDQAYTCAKIIINPKELFGSISSTAPYKVINLDGVYPDSLESITLSWHSNSNSGASNNNSYAKTNNGKVSFNIIDHNNAIPNPAIVSLQIVQTPRQFSFDELISESQDGKTNRATMFFVPTDGTEEDQLGDSKGFIKLYDVNSESGNFLTASQVADNNNLQKNVPYLVRCNTNSEETFACSVKIELPHSYGEDDSQIRNNKTFSLIVSSPYVGQGTTFSIEYDCFGGSCASNEGSNSDQLGVSTSQIVIDATGRAGDMYKRQEIRIDSGTTTIASGYPAYAIQAETIKKLVKTDTEHGIDIPDIFTPITRELIIDLTGGSGVQNSVSCSSINDTCDVVIPSATPIRNNYVFDGYSISQDSSEISYHPGDTYSFAPGVTSATIYAVWHPAQYVIDYYGNGGTTSIGSTKESQNVQVGATVNLIENPFIYSGYVFQGWATSPTGSVVYADKASVKDIGTPTSPANLYAVWEEQVTYTVNYNLNGGTGTTPASQTVVKGTTITLPSSSGFSRTNYYFDGWLENDPSFATVYNPGSNYTVISNVTFYAKWLRETYQIMFYGNGGARNDGVTQTTQTANRGANVTLAANPFVRSGYTFKGWATSPTGSVVYADKASVKDIGTPTSPANLYAVWEEQVTYTVNYNLNGGTGTTPASQTVVKGTTITLPSSSGFSRTNYYFDGWLENDPSFATVYNPGSNYTVISNVTFYAKWVASSSPTTTYQVIYRRNCNSSDTITKVYQVNSGSQHTIISKPSNFTCSGYTFDGWQNADWPYNSYTIGSKITVGNNITINAKWKEDSVTPSPSTSCPAGFSEWTTGLCWRNIDQTGLFNQSGARSSCSSSGWRLPTVNEYRTLVNKYCDSAYAGNEWYCTGDTVTSKGFGYNGARIKESATKCTVEKSECEKYNEKLLSGCNTWIQQMKQCDMLPDSSMVSQCKEPFQNGYNQCISNVEQRNCSAVYNQCMSNLSDTMIYQEDGKPKGGYWANENSGVMVMQQDGSDSTVVVGIDAWHILTNTSDSYISTRCVVNK